MAPSKLLLDKVALITGAGGGYGEGIAKLFAEEGAKVLVVDIKEEGGQRVVSEIVATGGLARFVNADVTKEPDWRRALETAKNEFGGLDVLVNNAGWSYRLKDTLTVTEDEYDQIFNVNVKSIYHSVNVCMPHFISQGSGSIINVSSCITIRPNNGLVWYAASKGAVDTVTRSLAAEFTPKGVRVNAILPSYGETPLTPTFLGRSITPEITTARSAESLVKRVCMPMDIAKAALYFATPYFNDFQTGIVLAVDGGTYIKST